MRIKRLGVVVMGIVFLLSPLTLHANTVTLTWDRNTEIDATGYNIYRALAPSTTFLQKANLVLIAQPAVGTATVTFVDVTPANVAYNYVVRAVNQAGLESGNSNIVLANPLPPAPPRNLTIPSLVVNLSSDGTVVATGPTPLSYTLTVHPIAFVPFWSVRRNLTVVVE